MNHTHPDDFHADNCLACKAEPGKVECNLWKRYAAALLNRLRGMVSAIQSRRE